MTLVSALYYICIFLGLATTSAYTVTFFVLPYNTLYLEGQSGTDEQDVPYVLAIVECAVSAATMVMGLIAFSSQPRRSALLTTLVFFAVFAVLEGTLSVVRAWHLGLLGDDMAQTCSDSLMTGCPTTRFESASRDILFTEPMGGECSFFFWNVGGSMPTRSEWSANNFADCADAPGGAQMCQERLETYMDWSKATSYGWRDDPNALQQAMASANSLTTFPKVHNMQKMMQFQLDYNRTLTQSVLYTEQPSISYCWYWGCHAVCQPLRWAINRWWLCSSLLLFALHTANMGMVIKLFVQTPPPKEKTGLPTSNPNTSNPNPEFVMKAPVLGRRNRPLSANPGGLYF